MQSALRIHRSGPTSATRLFLAATRKNMSRFGIPGRSGSTIQVHLPPEESSSPERGEASITKDELLSFPAFKDWLSNTQHSLSLQAGSAHPFHAQPYHLESISVQAVDRFGRPPNGRIGFVKLTSTVVNADGEKLPGSVFLRGGSVAMLIVLQPDDVPAGSETDKHVLLTVQARIPAGSLAFVEIPAGMLDDDSGTFSGTAAKEIKEELDIEVPSDQLVDMTKLAIQAGESAEQEEGQGHDQKEDLKIGVYPSPGGCDEFIPIFLHQRRVKRSQLQEWTGKLTGLREHGERITLKCVPLADVWKVGTRDAKLLSALALYHGLKSESKI